MEVNNLPILGTTVDTSQVPPIHQKRILAFVNHFITSTCSFLNDFILTCENKFIDLERKIQRVEASLIIIELKIASIPGLDKSIGSPKSSETPIEKPKEDQIVEETRQEESPVEEQPSEPLAQGVTASNDSRYRKYFKMVQFGVPTNAVKMKMSAEGFDPDILDTPDRILPDGTTHEQPTDEQ